MRFFTHRLEELDARRFHIYKHSSVSSQHPTTSLPADGGSLSLTVLRVSQAVFYSTVLIHCRSISQCETHTHIAVQRWRKVLGVRNTVHGRPLFFSCPRNSGERWERSAKGSSDMASRCQMLGPEDQEGWGGVVPVCPSVMRLKILGCERVQLSLQLCSFVS